METPKRVYKQENISGGKNKSTGSSSDSCTPVLSLSHPNKIREGKMIRFSPLDGTGFEDKITAIFPQERHKSS